MYDETQTVFFVVLENASETNKMHKLVRNVYIQIECMENLRIHTIIVMIVNLT